MPSLASVSLAAMYSTEAAPNREASKILPALAKDANAKAKKVSWEERERVLSALKRRISLLRFLQDSPIVGLETSRTLSPVSSPFPPYLVFDSGTRSNP